MGNCGPGGTRRPPPGQTQQQTDPVETQQTDPAAVKNSVSSPSIAQTFPPPMTSEAQTSPPPMTSVAQTSPPPMTSVAQTSPPPMTTTPTTTTTTTATTDTTATTTTPTTPVSNPDDLRVKCRFSKGSDEVVTIALKARIGDLKQKISQKRGIDMSRLFIYFIGQEIDDSHLIISCGLNKKDVLQIMVMPEQTSEVDTEA